MTKKVYTKPELKSEAFVPQTHVAACGDSGTVYKFTCNAGKKWKHYNVYYMNGNKKLCC